MAEKRYTKKQIISAVLSVVTLLFGGGYSLGQFTSPQDEETHLMRLETHLMKLDTAIAFLASDVRRGDSAKAIQQVRDSFELSKIKEKLDSIGSQQGRLEQVVKSYNHTSRYGYVCNADGARVAKK